MTPVSSLAPHALPLAWYFRPSASTTPCCCNEDCDLPKEQGGGVQTVVIAQPHRETTENAAIEINLFDYIAESEQHQHQHHHSSSLNLFINIDNGNGTPTKTKESIKGAANCCHYIGNPVSSHGSNHNGTERIIQLYATALIIASSTVTIGDAASQTTQCHQSR
eukprot:scaffold8889_cov74-Cyclotella_meneghiniana.AAC.3